MEIEEKCDDLIEINGIKHSFISCKCFLSTNQHSEHFILAGSVLEAIPSGPQIPNNHF
jgi:hypothetical protein